MTDTSIERRTLIALAGAAALLPHAAGATAANKPAGLTVIATIVAKPDGADAMRTALTKLAASARAEPGCLGYLLYEDGRAPGHFYTYEHWTDDAALDRHLGAPAMAAAAAQFGTLLAAPPVISRLRAL